MAMETGKLRGPIWWAILGVLYLVPAMLVALYSGACLVGSGCGYGALPAIGMIAVLLPVALVFGGFLIAEARRRIAAGARRSGAVAIVAAIAVPLCVFAFG